MTTGAIIQARRSSKRFPDKVLKNLPYNSNYTVLKQVICRVKTSKRVNDIVVATTTLEEDGLIVKIANEENVKWFRGSCDNVLERFYLAAKDNKFDTIVRITADCPCIDPEVIDFVIGQYEEAQIDFASNALERTFPHATDVEVLRFRALEDAYREATEMFEKEHVCPYIYRTRPELFKIQAVKAKPEWHGP